MDVSSGDDGFAINAFSTNTTNILVRDSIFRTGHGVSIGSGTYQTISNVVFRNLQILNSKYGTRMKAKTPPSSYPSGNSKVSNILYENITVKNTDQDAILWDGAFSGDGNPNLKISDITFKNYNSDTSGKSTSFQLLPNTLLKPIILNNVIIANAKRSGEPNTNVKFDVQGPVKGVNGVADS